MQKNSYALLDQDAQKKLEKTTNKQQGQTSSITAFAKLQQRVIASKYNNES